MADYRSMFDREHIGAWDLEGRDVVVEIAGVRAGEVIGAGGRKARKPVLSFAGKAKTMLCNSTNAKAIAAMYGNDAAAWVGKKITLYPSTTTLGAETVDCIRVRPGVPS
ncbi:MAG: hypothetical protein FJ027_19020 [Candidatus Rokubacteria bacterium]|nr:hypothetical protein [Candidatus Rokubacteria bacterium]